MNHLDTDRQGRVIIVATVYGVVAGIISSFHHWYGAAVYATPWRSGISYWIVGSVLIIYSLLFIHWKCIDKVIGKIALWIFFFGAVVFQTGFTLFECVYSHVLKNLFFFTGVPLSILERLYPEPAYHLPDNLFFEITGLLQLVGLLAAWYAYRVFQAQPPGKR